ncbi:coiled-coil domain-containing protein 9B [Rhinophrynus dorsalis]
MASPDTEIMYSDTTPAPAEAAALAIGNNPIFSVSDCSHKKDEKLQSLDVIKMSGEGMKKSQKDAELDKRIEALRKRNEALIRRYEEVEEDRKNAEKGVAAFKSQKPKEDRPVITITKTSNEKRSESLRDSCDSEDASNQGISFNKGNTMQRSEIMDSNAEGKRVVPKMVAQDYYYPIREPPYIYMNIQQMNHLFTYGRGHRLQVLMGMKNDAKKKTEAMKMNLEKDKNKLGEKYQRQSSDLTISVAEQEHLEYLRWKKERDEIDYERIARQKNSRGEWRRAWDFGKNENM